jgi:hypothetical protein
MSWRKMVPLEVYPLGVFTGVVISFASFRIYKLMNHNEVQLTKGTKEKFQWKEETGANQQTMDESDEK